MSTSSAALHAKSEGSARGGGSSRRARFEERPPCSPQASQPRRRLRGRTSAKSCDPPVTAVLAPGPAGQAGKSAALAAQLPGPAARPRGAPAAEAQPATERVAGVLAVQLAA